MVTGNQKVKTPTGWNSTQGAWVKTGATTWKAVEQIYVKTPTGWNNASGQALTQQPYPYIANAQQPYIANAQQPYPYIANAQQPYIANAQQPYPYIANAQTPYIANAQQPYPYIANSQTPFTYQARSPFTYSNRYPANAQQPYIANSQTPFTYNARSPFTYNARYPANAQQPYIANARQPFTYNNRSPFTYNARYPANAQQPYIANARQPGTYQVPFSYRVPYIANARQPGTYQVPFTYRVPYIANAQQPYTYSFRYPFLYQAAFQKFGFDGGCFLCCVHDTMLVATEEDMKSIYDLNIGDKVISHNFETGQDEVVEITDIVIVDRDVDYKVNDLIMTEDHPVYLEGGRKASVNPDATLLNYKQEVDQLVVGDKMMKLDGSLEEITSIEHYEGNHKNFAVQTKYNNFYANGHLVDSVIDRGNN